MAASTVNYLDPLVVSRLDNLELKAKLIVEGFITGLHKSPYHGFSVEFAEHRAYNSGESLRNIDWKVFGKTDKLYSKKYEEETNLRCHLVLDVSDSMRYPAGEYNKLVYGLHLAAALGYLMIHQRDAVGLSAYDTALRLQYPAKAKLSWLRQLLAGMDGLLENRPLHQHGTHTAQVLHQLAQKLGRRALVVVITDLLGQASEVGQLYTALQHLRHANHEVVIFQLLHQATEAQFDFADETLVLKDLESGREVTVEAEQLREQYVARVAAYLAGVRQRCRDLRVDMVEVDIEQPYHTALLNYLKFRERMLR